jgi:hypothetical protein
VKHSYIVSRILDHFPGLQPEHITARLKFSTYANIRKRYLYLAVPKAACTQMKWVLRAIEGAGPVELFTDEMMMETTRDMFVHARSNVPLPSIVDLDNKTQKFVLESPDFLRMTIVRNPYSRLLSAWMSKVLLCEPSGKNVYLKVKGRLPDTPEKSLVTFDEFVKFVEGELDFERCDLHWARQFDCTFFPAMNFSFVGKVEHLNESLQRLEHHLELTESLRANGRNESLPLGTASYTEELAGKVYSLYRTDFEAFGYEENSWVAAGARNHSQGSENGTSTADKLRDEIIERNLLLMRLFEERGRIKPQLRLLALNCMVAIREKRKRLRAQLRQLLGSAKTNPIENEKPEHARGIR